MLILDLCGGTGSWSTPYRQAGYDVLVIDPQAIVSEGVRMTVRDFLRDTRPFVKERVHGVLAAPPCTEFAGSGARWWADKPPYLLENAIQVVRDCLRCINIFEPHWWCLENPVGRLARCVPEIGKHVATFQPYDYGDPWSKRTCLWGNFCMPDKAPVPRDPDPRKGQAVWYASPSPERQKLRSITPPGFANAFAQANP